MAWCRCGWWIWPDGTIRGAVGSFVPVPLTTKTNVKIDDLLHTTQQRLDEHGHIRYTSVEFEAIGPEHVAAVQESYGATALMQLPEHEVTFFEWLRSSDGAVWADLWGDDAEAPYLVSLAYLESFSGENAGGRYYIRDLQTVDNYFFTPDMVLEKESADFLAATRSRLEERESLTLNQAFALQVSVGPTDVWHFAYDHKRPVEAVKKAVSELVEDHILVHVPNADHLTDHFDVD